MTKRDVAWRFLGALLLIGASSIEVLVPGDAGGPRGFLTFVLLAVALSGLLLMIQGRKVALAFRVDSSRHRQLPELIRSRRRQRPVRRRR